MPNDKVGKVMGEFKRRTLKSGGSGKTVTSRNQAIAIAMSESGKTKKASVSKKLGKAVKRTMKK